MDRWQIEHIEAEFGEFREPCSRIPQRAAAYRVGRHRARKEFVPGPPPGALAVDDEGQHLAIGGVGFAIAVDASELRQLLVTGRTQPSIQRKPGIIEPRGGSEETDAIDAVRAGGKRPKQFGTLLPLRAHVPACRHPSLDVMQPRPKAIDPGHDRVSIPSDLRGQERCLPHIVRLLDERNLAPDRRAIAVVDQRALQAVVPVGEEMRLNGESLTDSGLGGVPPTIDLRRHGVDDDARGQIAPLRRHRLRLFSRRKTATESAATAKQRGLGQRPRRDAGVSVTRSHRMPRGGAGS